MRYCQRHWLRTFLTKGLSSKETNVPPKNSIIIPQASNRQEIWSQRQNPKANAIELNPRFSVPGSLEAQPNPPAAIELAKSEPVVMVEKRVTFCDGDGLLGHPRVFINLVSL